MAHAVHASNFGRNTPWRKATVRSLAQALLTREKIRTTHAKAKETQRLADRLITLGKDGTLASRRRAISILNDPELVRRLFTEIAPRFSKRSGGYTRVLHDGFRAGDSASMSLLELVELAPEKKTPVKEKGKGKEKPAKGSGAPVAPKEEVKRPKKEEHKTKEPEEAKPEKQAEKEKKTGGFIEGLRGFFKHRDNPNP